MKCINRARGFSGVLHAEQEQLEQRREEERDGHAGNIQRSFMQRVMALS